MSSVLQPACEIVTQEVGPEPDTADLVFLAESGIIPELSADIAATYTRPRDIPYKGATRAMGVLGCDNCIIRDDCPLGANLQVARSYHSILLGVAQEVALDATGSTPEGPQWLKLARESRTRIPIDIFINTPEAENAPSWFNLDEVRAGIADEGPQEFTKAQVSELGILQNLSDNTVLTGNRLTAIVHGDQFMLIDASEHIATGEAAPALAQRILLGKLLGRLVERDGTGKPHILSPDNTTQKVIRTLDNGVMLCEIRMAGKNRLYVTINPNESTTRIIMLGSHGGDAKTQQKFLNAVLPKS